jgi:hypothetical protein
MSVFNVIDAKKEINEVIAKLREAWSKYGENRIKLENAKTKLGTAKKSNSIKDVDNAWRDYNDAKDWMTTYAHDIEKMQKDISDLYGLSDVKKKPAIPTSDITKPLVSKSTSKKK